MKLFIGLFLSVSITAFSAEPTGRYKNIIDQLNAIQKQYSNFSQVYSIGKNDDGVDLYAIRISTTPNEVDHKKIGQLIVSTHHGDESATPIFTLAFIRDLLNRYSSDELYRGNLADQEWTIVPVLNISGYNANRRQEHGIDPNREYASPCTSKPGPKLKSLQRVVELIQSRVFVGSVTVHGYDGSMTYPWGLYTTNTHSSDHNQYHQIFSKAAEHNGYRVGTASDVVYPANGCFEDWIYWKFGAWSLLLELASGSQNDIQRTVPAIGSFFDQLSSSPSNNHELTSQCTQHRGPDLRVE